MATSHHVPEMITPSKWDGWSFSKQPPPPSPTLQFNRFLGLEMTLTIFEKLKQNSRDWCIVKQHHPQIKGPYVKEKFQKICHAWTENSSDLGVDGFPCYVDMQCILGRKCRRFFTNTAPLVLNITNIIMFANPPLWKFRIQAVLHIFISTVTMVNQDHLHSVIQFALDRT